MANSSGDDSVRFRVYFVRHGETDDNVRGVLQGQVDTRLSANGNHQAQLLGQLIAHTSPLQRCRETLRLITAEPPATTSKMDENECPQLMEQAYGVFEGRAIVDYMAAKDEHRSRHPRDVEFAPDGGETNAQLADRVTRWLETFLTSTYTSLRSSATSTPSVLVVAHGGTLMSLSHTLRARGCSFERRYETHAKLGNTHYMLVCVTMTPNVDSVPAESSVFDRFAVTMVCDEYNSAPHLCEAFLTAGPNLNVDHLPA